MIDWATLLIPIRSHWVSGRVLLLSDSGEIVKEYGRSGRVRGSGSASIEVRDHRIDNRPYLWVDGNPAKFFQGHNVDGSESPDLLRRFGRAVARALGVEIAGGDWYVNRVDVNRMFRVGSGTDADAVRWLRATEKVATVKHRGRGTLQAGTWYVGQKSRRWTLKAYCKGVEMRSRRPRGYSLMRSPTWAEALEFSTGCVRLELCLRRPELLKSGYRLLRKWSGSTAGELFDMYVSRLDLPEKQAQRLDVAELSSAARGVYYAWKAGEHLPAIMSRAAFYRWRSFFRESYGIDVASDPLEGGDVVPLIRTLEARQVSAPPHWLYSPAA